MDAYEQNEMELQTRVTSVESTANKIVVSDQPSYSYAAQLLKEIKNSQKRVTEFFEPMRKSAYESYHEIMSRRKTAMDPLASAEKIIKQKMSAYCDEVDRRNREAQELVQKAAKAELEKKLQEAVAAEKNGDMIVAEMAMMEAQMIEAAGKDIQVGSKVKVSGISTGIAYEIESIDPFLVPTMFGGVEIRPVDQKAVLNLIKESGGNISIPGIKYKKVTKISVR